MEFQKIVEELISEIIISSEDKKKGIIAANFTTNTGRYASAQVGTSAGVLAPQFQTASNGGSKSSNEQSSAGVEDDAPTNRSNYRKNSSKGCRGSAKNGSKGSKGTIIKYKPVDFGGAL